MLRDIILKIKLKKLKNLSTEKLDEVLLIILFILLVGLFSPYLGILIGFLITIILKNNYFYDFIAFLIIFYLSYINFHKVVEGDLILYLEWYENAHNLDFLYYIKNSIMDIFFHILLYLHSVIFKDFHSFVFLCTFIIYLLYYMTLKVWINNKKYSIYYALLLFILFSFTNEIFSISAHAIRQFMAAGFLVFSLVQDTKNKRNLFFLISCFTHFSSILFLPIYVFPIQASKYRKYLLYIIIFSFIIYFASLSIFNYLGRIETNFKLLQNILGRFSQQETAYAEDIGIKGFLLIIISFMILINLKPNKYEMKLILLSFYLSCFLLVISPYKLLLLRYYFYLYFLLPLTIPLLQERLKIRFDKIIVILLFVFFIRFSNFYSSSVWNYGIDYNLLIQNFIW